MFYSGRKGRFAVEADLTNDDIINVRLLERTCIPPAVPRHVDCRERPSEPRFAETSSR